MKNVTFENGDYVLTKDGKLGTVIYGEYWDIWSHALIYTHHGSEQDAIKARDNYQKIFPCTLPHQTPFKHSFVPTKIKVDGKEIEVSNDEIIKVYHLYIEPERISLPVEEAKKLMEILDEHWINYKIKTDIP